MLPIFAIGLLGMLGLERLMEVKLDKTSKRKILIALGSTAGIALLLALFAGAFRFRGVNDNPQWPDWLKNGLTADRKSFLRADALRSFIFITLFAGVWYLSSIQKISKSIVYGLIILIIGLDVVIVGKRVLTENNF